MKTKYLILFPILLTLAACQRMELEDPTLKDNVNNDGDVWTLTVEATKGETETKALDLVNNESRLNAYWKNTETVKVYQGGSLIGTLNVTPGSGDKPTTATLSGEITSNTPQEGDELTLLIPRETWVYTGQNGALTGENSIEDTFDYAMATVTVSSVSGNTITTSGAVFQNQQSIYRFSFNGIDNQNQPLQNFSIQEFTISSTNNTLVRKMAWGSNSEETGSIIVTPGGSVGPSYYVALRNKNTTANDVYTFNVNGTIGTNSNALLIGKVNVPSGVLDAPKFISALGITISQPDFSPADGEITSSSDVL